MAIKKAFTAVHSLLAANQSAVVESLMPQLTELMSAKAGGGGGKATTFHKSEDGTVVAVQCYYFKQWMDPRLVDFGAKAGSATGLNSMCKAGLSAWTKQQAAFRKAKEQLLADVAEGTIAATDIKAKLEELEVQRDTIIDVPADIQAFETLEDCTNNSDVNGLAV